MKEFAPFRLDTANQCLWRHRETPDEERVLLKPKAFGVLQYLVDHAGRLVTQDELLDALWPDTHVQPEVLKNQILRIRNALGDRARSPHFIETQPRRGYRFIAPIHDGASALPLIRPAPAGRLVGRATQLRELTAHLDSAAHDECRILFLAGEPGIGKTALVDEFHRGATSTPSIRIARGQCLEGYGGKEAYYPMLEALGALCRGPDGPGLVQILGDQAPTWLVQFPALLKREHRQTLQREIQGATRERMLREICEAIELMTAAGPLLLIFEDLQWVDPSTVDLIAALARCRRPIRLMLLATYRPADAALAGHPLNAVKRDLLGHRLCREIVLGPLTEDEVAGYLAGELPTASLPEGLAALVYRRSEGNPLFMVASLDHMTESGFLARDSDGWRLLVPLKEIDLGVPESLRQMIEAQIEGLTAGERLALEAASIAGATFSPMVSAAAAGLSADGFEEHCEELSRRHRLVRHADSQPLGEGESCQRFEFVHALYREVCYRRQPAGRRASLHRRTGLRLEELFPDRLSDLAPELAHHFESGSEWARAARYLRLTAETARRRYAHREAAVILEHALELLHRIPEAERLAAEIEIMERLAPTYLVVFDPRAIQTYEALAARAAQIGRTDLEIDALVDLAMPLASVSTRRYLEVLERALRIGTDQADPILRAKTRATCLVRRMAASGWNPQDADECRASLEFTPRSGNREALASQLIDRSFVQSLSSEYRQAYRNAKESVALLSQQGHPENPYLNVAHWLMHRSLLFLGEWGEAQRAIDAAIAGVEKNGDSYRIHTLRLFRAWVHIWAMDFGSALQICESVRPSVRSVGSPAGMRHCLVLTGMAEAGLERFEAARQHLMEARDGMDRETVLLDWYWRIALESSLTELWLAQRNLPQARPQAERFLHASLAAAERTWQALAWDANARVAAVGQDAGRAAECIGNALATLEGYEAPIAAWRVHATAAELCQRRGDTAAAARHRELSRATILKLANSLAEDSPLREAFRSAPSTAGIVGGLPDLRLS